MKSAGSFVAGTSAAPASLATLEDAPRRMRRRVAILAVLVGCSVASVSSAGSECRSSTGAAPVHRLQISSPAHRAGAIAGASSLFHLDDDRFWIMKKENRTLASLHLSPLRFPGGEVADNYDWMTGRVERPSEWPREASSPSGTAERTDYREFIQAATESGARDLFFVVNVDGAFHAPGDVAKNLRLYADKAAQWVKAVKDQGRRVRYWEIGNEPYLGVGYPLSVEEYAAALNAFAAAMRAVDPDILIGAAGPPWADAESFADVIGPDALQSIRSGRITVKKACQGLDSRKCVAKLRGGKVTSSERTRWWPRLLELAGKSFDFAVIHQYGRPDWLRDRSNSYFRETFKLGELRRRLASAKGRAVPVALTEWNTPNAQRHGGLTDFSHLMDVAVLIGHIAVSEIDFAHYWPLRAPGSGFRGLLTDDGKISPPGVLFDMLDDLVPGAKVSESLAAEGTYVLQMEQHDGTVALMIVNRAAAGHRFILPTAAETSLTIKRLLEGVKGSVTLAEPCSVSADMARSAGVDVPGRSVNLIVADPRK